MSIDSDDSQQRSHRSSQSNKEISPTHSDSFQEHSMRHKRIKKEHIKNNSKS